MKYILGKKIEMTRLWQGETVVPVTKVTVGPCRVVQIKTEKNDGYDAVQLAYGERKAKNIAKPQLKHTEGLGSFRWLREFRYNFAGRTEEKTEFESLSRGDVIDASTFAVGDMVNVVGHSKGRGFQGGVKRHGFHGHNTTHGTKDQVRMPGSIGAGEPQHVFKGTRMAGRMGNEQVTVQNLEIIEVNPEDNTILIKGGLPGARNSLLMISGKGELKINRKPVQPPSASPAAPSSKEVMEDKEAMADESESKPVEKIESNEPKEEIVEKAEPEVIAPVKEEINIEKIPDTKKVETVEIKTETPAEVKIASASETKPESKVVEKVAEPVKAEEIKPEPASAVVEEKPVVAAPAPAPKDVYLKMFENIPQAERERLSSPEAMAAITVLEETFKIDLLPIVTKLATKEVKPEELASHLALILKIEQVKAEEIANAIKDKKLC